MIAPGLPGPWPDLLAAYVDGELDAGARAVVERWVAAHSGALDELRTQRQLSPENWRLWQQVEPPLPSEETWAEVEGAIAAGAMPGPASPPVATPVTSGPRGRWVRAGALLVGGVAAAAAVVLVVSAVATRVAPDRHPGEPGRGEPVAITRPASPGEDPLTGYPVLPIAAEDDVDIQRVAGNGGGWLPVGELPLPGGIVLASADDVQLEGVDPHPAWPAGGPQLSLGQGDAPMIFAADPR